MQDAARSSEPLDTTLEVETPEHVRFRYHLAGPGRRAGAYLVDLIARGVLLIALFIILGLAGSIAGFEVGAMLLVYFALEWGYYLVSELLMNGASLGKRALRLRVVQADGLPITFTDSFLRNLVRAADLLPAFYAFGLLSMMLDSKFRRLGDLVAGTIVIYEPRTTLRAPRRSRRFEVDGRQRAGEALYDEGALPQRPVLSREERQALALFSRRHPQLNPQRAEELADLIAPALAKRWGVRYRSSAAFLQAVHQRASVQASAGGR